MPPNRLSHETSPYLLQHADNPVDWYAWGDDALARARDDGKPVLLSIGYAACHWCHVMAHESFEDPDIAAVMNELFVNIKVDREERPDLDTIYQSALALLGEQGGWPLTMFCTPDAKPFWGGTYFPPTARFGRPAFPDLLRQIAKIYVEQRTTVDQNSAALLGGLVQISTPQPGGMIAPAALDGVAALFAAEVDGVNGGIGGAPKFPQVSPFKLMWRVAIRNDDQALRNKVLFTLDKMAQGGIYDHLGGGFARYATDPAWLVPHFEKMLYDNAQLAELYTEAWQGTRNPLYAHRVAETCDWVIRDLTNNDGDGGGFAATLDADSEGVEGKYYVWSESEVDALLGPGSAAFKSAYDVTPAGNWEGRTILNRTARPTLGDGAAEAALAANRQRLLVVRQSRIAPGRDDKVLADWNGLMITALATLAPVFDRPDWLAAAARAFDFVLTNLRPASDHRLYHSWCAGTPRYPATLDDYANMARAALALLEATADARYLEHATAWVDVADRHFWDASAGGYFFTADDITDVITRTKNAHDAATPSGNGTMVDVLARLYYLTGNDARRERAESIVATFSGEAARNPFAFAHLLNAVLLLADGLQIVVAGSPDDGPTRTLVRPLYDVAIPSRIVSYYNDLLALPTGHPAHGKSRVDGGPTVYVCHGQRCSLPITDAGALAAELAGA